MKKDVESKWVQRAIVALLALVSALVLIDGLPKWAPEFWPGIVFLGSGGLFFAFLVGKAILESHDLEAKNKDLKALIDEVESQAP